MSIYTDITNEIIAIMETAKSNEKLWNTLTSDHFDARNHITGNYYSGVNVFLLAYSKFANGYEHNEWMTIAQARKLGYRIRKGDTSTRCTFYKQVSKPAEKGQDEESYMILKPFYLFNIAQFVDENGKNVVENFEATKKTDFDPIEEGELILEKLKSKGANINFGGDKAFYSPNKDFIQLPQKSSFTKPEYFYSVLYHEAGHWTGAKTRLDRDLEGRFGDAKYAMEELVAELASAFMCARTGIIKKTMENHACYLNSWIQVLKSDPKAIFKASTLAQNAHDFIMA